MIALSQNNNITAETHVSIPFHDIDSMGVAWHGHYAKYLEIARCKLLHAIDYSYQEMSESGVIWPVVEMKTKYIAPLVFEQQILVRAELVEWAHRIRINYRIFNVSTMEVVSKAHTIQMAVETTTKTTLFDSPTRLIENVSLKIKALSC